MKQNVGTWGVRKRAKTFSTWKIKVGELKIRDPRPRKVISESSSSLIFHAVSRRILASGRESCFEATIKISPRHNRVCGMSWLLSGTCVFEQGPGKALLHTSEIKRAEFLAGVLEGRWKKKAWKLSEIESRGRELF